MKITRMALSVLAVTILSHAAIADVGGGRLMSKEGTTGTRPEDAVATIAVDKLIPTTDSDKIKSLTGIVNMSVQSAERVVRVAPDANATNVQRDELKDSKVRKLRDVVRDLPGTTVIATVTILDVQDTTIMHGDEAAIKMGKYTIVGRIEWLTEPVLTDSERQRIADINKSTDDSIASLKSKQTKLNDTTGFYQKKINEIDSTRQREIKEIRDNAGKRRPVHLAYLLTDDANVLSWKRGETRSVQGVVQTFGAFIYGFDKLKTKTKPDSELNTSNVKISGEASVILAKETVEGLYVGTESIVRIFKLSSAPDNAAGTQPAKSSFVARDRVILTSGRVIEGIATEDGDNVNIKGEMGTISVKKSEIKETDSMIPTTVPAK